MVEKQTVPVLKSWDQRFCFESCFPAQRLANHLSQRVNQKSCLQLDSSFKDFPLQCWKVNFREKYKRWKEGVLKKLDCFVYPFLVIRGLFKIYLKTKKRKQPLLDCFFLTKDFKITLFQSCLVRLRGLERKRGVGETDQGEHNLVSKRVGLNSLPSHGASVRCHIGKPPSISDHSNRLMVLFTSFQWKEIPKKFFRFIFLSRNLCKALVAPVLSC